MVGRGRGRGTGTGTGIRAGAGADAGAGGASRSRYGSGTVVRVPARHNRMRPNIIAMLMNSKPALKQLVPGLLQRGWRKPRQTVPCDTGRFPVVESH